MGAHTAALDYVSACTGAHLRAGDAGVGRCHFAQVASVPRFRMVVRRGSFYHPGLHVAHRKYK